MIKSFDQLFPPDKDLIDEPVRFDIADGIYLMICRLDNPEFMKARDHVYKSNKFQFDHEILDDERKSQLLIPALSKAVLKGWGGVPGADGKPIAYSPAEGARRMRESKAFLANVVQMARQTSAFVRELEEEQGKN